MESATLKHWESRWVRGNNNKKQSTAEAAEAQPNEDSRWIAWARQRSRLLPIGHTHTVTHNINTHTHTVTQFAKVPCGNNYMNSSENAYSLSTSKKSDSKREIEYLGGEWEWGITIDREKEREWEKIHLYNTQKPNGKVAAKSRNKMRRFCLFFYDTLCFTQCVIMRSGNCAMQYVKGVQVCICMRIYIVYIREQ